MKGKFRFRNLIIIVLCTIFVCGFIKQQSAMNRIKKETNEKLTEEINMSQTDEYNEKLAREKLNMIKDGEKSVEKESSGASLIDETSKQSSEESSNEEDNSNSNNE